MQAKISILKTSFGDKIVLESEYNAALVQAIKSLPWDTTHRKWTGSHWELDAAAAPELAHKLASLGMTDLVEELHTISGGKQATWADRLNLHWEVEEGQILLSCNYNKDIVALCHEFEAWWIPEEKVWVFKLDIADQLSAKLVQQYDSSMVIPKSVLEEAYRTLPEPTATHLTITVANRAILKPLKPIFEQEREFKTKIRELLGFQHPHEKTIRKHSKKDLSWWDGRVVHVEWDKTNDALIFDNGWVPVVADYVENLGFKVEQQDTRPMLDLSGPTKVQMHFDLQLYECQAEAVQHILGKLYDVGCCMYQLPTGVGKSIVSLKLIEQLKVKTIVLVNRRDLMYQWIRVFKEKLGVDAGQVGDSVYNPQEITVATVQSLWNYLKEAGAQKASNDGLSDDMITKFIDSGEVEKDYAPVAPELFKQFSLVILDEVHIGAADTFLIDLQSFTAKYFLGQSATTWRSDRMHPLLWGVFQKPDFERNINDAIALGHIVGPEIRVVEGITITDDELEDIPKAKRYNYVLKQIKESHDRNLIIAQTTRDAPHPCLVFTTQTSHQAAMKAVMKEIGLHPVVVNGSSKMDYRKAILQEMTDRKRHADIVLGNIIWDEGVDAPGIMAGVLAMPGRSDVKIIQRIGRMLRKLEGKSKAVIYYIRDHGQYVDDYYDVFAGICKQYGWL